MRLVLKLASVIEKDDEDFKDYTFQVSSLLKEFGTPVVNQTEKEVRLLGYRAGRKNYWVVTDRHDL